MEELKNKLDSLDAFQRLYVARYLLHSFIEQAEKDFKEHEKQKQNEK